MVKGDYGWFSLWVTVFGMVGTNKNDSIEKREARAVREGAAACYELALLYLKGSKSVSKDEIKAVDWFQKAATEYPVKNSGHKSHNTLRQSHAIAEAHFCLAQCYKSGIGVIADPDEELSWIQKASEWGHAGALYTLAQYYGGGTKNIQKDEAKASVYLKKAAKLNHPEALCKLAKEHIVRKQDHKNWSMAIRWFKKAAAQNCHEAQEALGYYYYHEAISHRAGAAAIAWWRKAAQQGNLEAQRFLAMSYLKRWYKPRSLADAFVLCYQSLAEPKIITDPCQMDAVDRSDVCASARERIGQLLDQGTLRKGRNFMCRFSDGSDVSLPLPWPKLHEQIFTHHL